jgi:hypothetical protein
MLIFCEVPLAEGGNMYQGPGHITSPSPSPNFKAKIKIRRNYQKLRNCDGFLHPHPG